MSSSFALSPLRLSRLLRATAAASSRSVSGPLAGQGELVGGQPRRRGVALFDRLGDLDLELGVEQRNPADLLEIGVHRVLGAASRITARGGPLPVGLAACIRPDGAVGLRHSPRFLRGRDLEDKVFLFVRHERDAFGVDPIDECREHLRSQLDRVQRLDQFRLRELSFGTTDGERRVEVDLRDPGWQRDVRDRRQRIGGRVRQLDGAFIDRDCRLFAHPRPANVVTPQVPSEPTTLPTGRPRRCRRVILPVRPARAALARSRPPGPATSLPPPATRSPPRRARAELRRAGARRPRSRRDHRGQGRPPSAPRL